MIPQEALRHFEEQVCKHCCEWDKSLRHCNTCPTDTAKKALEKQATSEWIPVSERLPEEYESVLFSTHFGGVKFGYITSYREWKDEAEGYTHCDDEVTAWQPIPEPWKGDANGEDD